MSLAMFIASGDNFAHNKNMREVAYEGVASMVVAGTVVRWLAGLR
jgi:hypothetical protein